MTVEAQTRLSGNIQALLNAIPTPVLLVDRHHRVVELNDSFCRFTGSTREALLYKGPQKLFGADVAERLCEAHANVLRSGEDHESEETVTDRAGRLRHVINRRRRITLDGQDLVIEVLTDVTDVRQAEEKSRHLALHDPLTGLPNRILLNGRLEQALSADAGSALLYIDLDRFKDVNDALGHPAGDELLCQFASRLCGVVRGSDMVARLGGDEFAVMLASVADTLDAEETCRRVLGVAHEAFELSCGRAFVGASVGLASAGGELLTRDELHRRADLALYDAKRGGRGCYRIFSQRLDERMQLRRELEIDLRVALAAGDQLEVYYQPVIESPGERLKAMEALVRWRHPRLGLLLPELFIPIAEEAGLVVALGAWVLETATRMVAGYPDVSIAVNLSPVQLRAEDIAERVLAIVDASGLPRERLQLEITETAILGSERDAAEKLHRLRQAGIKIVLDDFGTGYSSLSHLHRLEVDKVKIDHSFVQDLDGSEDSRAIIRAVLGMGQTLGIAVTAEGVESDAQRQFLRASGCTEFQGYLFSHPLPQRAAEAYLAKACARESR